jgi:RNA polymerase sigma factor (TIGR02999 family)
MSDVTKILNAIEQGDPHAAAQLLPLVYDELRRLAAQKLAQEQPGQTLQATALVHEAYLRLVGNHDDPARQDRGWDGCGHFFAAAAEAMRRILIDRAREKHADKRGGIRKRFDIDAIDVAIEAAPDQFLAIDDALSKLARADATAAKLVELRYFAGMSVEQAAQILGVSVATAYRNWKYARAWLHDELLGSAE